MLSRSGQRLAPSLVETPRRLSSLFNPDLESKRKRARAFLLPSPSVASREWRARVTFREREKEKEKERKRERKRESLTLRPAHHKPKTSNLLVTPGSPSTSASTSPAPSARSASRTTSFACSSKKNQTRSPTTASSPRVGCTSRRA